MLSEGLFDIAAKFFNKFCTNKLLEIARLDEVIEINYFLVEPG